MTTTVYRLAVLTVVTINATMASIGACNGGRQMNDELKDLRKALGGANKKRGEAQSCGVCGKDGSRDHKGINVGLEAYDLAVKEGRKNDAAEILPKLGPHAAAK